MRNKKAPGFLRIFSLWNTLIYKRSEQTKQEHRFFLFFSLSPSQQRRSYQDEPMFEEHEEIWSRMRTRPLGAWWTAPLLTPGSQQQQPQFNKIEIQQIQIQKNVLVHTWVKFGEREKKSCPLGPYHKHNIK